ncbi:hypothetical protein AYK20_08050 [Thermoplasmatales archaeon SG8-52-1]|nr:MAG: hypothetical protein AYK20_08050 [Thermoplasmatales archaeon SG8-52-1]
MPSESEIVISFIYKRSGKTKLSFSELYLTLSMDLNWFTPEDAKSFINNSLKKGLLIKNQEEIQPNFDYDKIIIPIGFTPSKQIFNEKIEIKKEEIEGKVLDKIIKRIVEKTNLDKIQIINNVNSTAAEKNITKEVAALLIGKEHNLKFDDFFKEVEQAILTENKG